MKKFVILLILAISCKPSTKMASEIITTQEIIDKGLEEMNSDKAKARTHKLSNEKEITEAYKKIILKSENKIFITSMNSILDLSSSTLNAIEEISSLFENRINENPSIKDSNRRNHAISNQFFITEKYGTKFKNIIAQTIESFLKIAQKNNLGIDKESLDLNINVEAWKNHSKSWEEYTFKDMPPGALYPLFQHFKNSTIIAKLQLLEKLKDMSSSN